MNAAIKYLIQLTMMVLFLPSFAQTSIPSVVEGNIERLSHFQSKYVTPRHVDIWLPPDYSDSSRYAVLYMHDGQMLYDPEKGWNKQSWNVDDAATDLLKSNTIQPFIVVGIWNGDTTRHSDYFPQKAFESMDQVAKDTANAQFNRSHVHMRKGFKPQSDNYLKFIVEELKPYIDENYAVHTDRANTYVAGSSMGGLISMYALCEYPDVFGGAICMSTHWIGTFTDQNNPIPDAFLTYLDTNLPEPGNHLFYFDCGDATLDQFYPPIQRSVDEIMKNKGYDQEIWKTQYFPGENHTEDSWSKRLHIPLTFMFGK